jgi:L-asparaginase
MQPDDSYSGVDDNGTPQLRPGTGGVYAKQLKPGSMLGNILSAVPDLANLASIELKVAFNKDSSNVGE